MVQVRLRLTLTKDDVASAVVTDADDADGHFVP